MCRPLLYVGLQGEYEKASCDFCWYICRACNLLHETLHNSWAIKCSLYHQVLLKYFWKWHSLLSFRVALSLVLCLWLWKESVCWWWDEASDLEMYVVYCIWLEWPLLAATDMWAVRHLVKLLPPCWYFLWQFWDSLQGDIQLISHLDLWPEFMVLFAACCPGCDSPVGLNLESLQPLSLLTVACSHLVLLDAQALRSADCLGWNSIIMSFSDIFQPNVAIKCVFDSLTVA